MHLLIFSKLYTVNSKLVFLKQAYTFTHTPSIGGKKLAGLKTAPIFKTASITLLLFRRVLLRCSIKGHIPILRYDWPASSGCQDSRALQALFRPHRLHQCQVDQTDLCICLPG